MLSTFEQQALSLFRIQTEKNAVYAEFVNKLKIKPEKVLQLKDIPFLPVEFFKTHQVTSGNFTPEIVFTSSGTTGNETSRHFVAKTADYEHSFINGFTQFYGNIEDYTLLALLPAYLEREGSSLIYMTEKLIALTGKPESGFYLNNTDELVANLLKLEAQNRNVLLLGVSFALLELAENYQLQLKNTIVMETGGMKGRRKEITREELHSKIKTGMGVNAVHSEYGMTEMLSQAYSHGNGIYYPSNTMKVLLRDAYDPLSVSSLPGSGAINIIDLSNQSSCAFIATQDLGKLYSNGSFEVLGRFDSAQIRGCNLLIN